MNTENKNSILIVDDESSSLLFLTRVLGAEYTIYTAKNGINAVEKAIKYSPDLILLDIIMPEMDGYEALTMLKELSETRDIPVIFITGLGSKKDEEKGLSYKAADYISKPFSSEIVKLRVRNQIQIVNLIRGVKHMSLTDQLTDLPNKRSFNERLRLEWRMSIREKMPISLLFIDIDNFKNHNDTYGHLQGDATLQTIAKILTLSLRRSLDFAARWGGEEFAVLLVNTESFGALEVAERIRVSIENTPILLKDGQTTKVAVSIGISTLIPTRDSSVDEFIRNADDALYTAKREGRNRICRHEYTLNDSIPNPKKTPQLQDIEKITK